MVYCFNMKIDTSLTTFPEGKEKDCLLSVLEDLIEEYNSKCESLELRADNIEKLYVLKTIKENIEYVLYPQLSLIENIQKNIAFLNDHLNQMKDNMVDMESNINIINNDFALFQ